MKRKNREAEVKVSEEVSELNLSTVIEYNPSYSEAGGAYTETVTIHIFRVKSLGNVSHSHHAYPKKIHKIHSVTRNAAHNSSFRVFRRIEIFTGMTSLFRVCHRAGSFDPDRGHLCRVIKTNAVRSHMIYEIFEDVHFVRRYVMERD